MLRYIHLSQRFNKQLLLLQKAGKKASIAAAQAELIIEHFQDSAEESDEVKIKRTRHGESRLKNCLKYDLGGGYRLIAIKEEGHLFFVCVGSHDDIDLWLERNRGYSIGLASQKEYFKTIELSAREKNLESGESCRESDHADFYEEDLLTRVDERTLRQLFNSFFSP